jgi:hypothetical protein
MATMTSHYDESMMGVVLGDTNHGWLSIILRYTKRTLLRHRWAYFHSPVRKLNARNTVGILYTCIGVYSPGFREDRRTPTSNVLWTTEATTNFIKVTNTGSARQVASEQSYGTEQAVHQTWKRRDAINSNTEAFGFPLLCQCESGSRETCFLTFEWFLKNPDDFGFFHLYFHRRARWRPFDSKHSEKYFSTIFKAVNTGRLIKAD